MQKWLSQIEKGDVKYASCSVAKVEGPISIRRMNKECMTACFPKKRGGCGLLSPFLGVLPAITLVFSGIWPSRSGAAVPRCDPRDPMGWMQTSGHWATAGRGGDRPWSKRPSKGPDIEDGGTDPTLGQG